MAGALTERDFVTKLEKARFDGIAIHERRPTSVDDLSLYPLFTDGVLDLMRKLIPASRQAAVAVAVVVSATAVGITTGASRAAPFKNGRRSTSASLSPS